jgi:hypothetical protein
MAQAHGISPFTFSQQDILAILLTRIQKLSFVIRDVQARHLAGVRLLYPLDDA